MTETSPASTAQRVQCPPNKEPAVRYFIVTAMCWGFGVYSIYEVLTGVGAGKPGEEWYGFTLASAWIAPFLGVLPFVLAIRMLLRTFVADTDGLGYAGGTKVPWSAVQKLVPRGKGLVDVRYKTDGQEGVFHLDSWKMQNFAELVRLVEAKTAGVPIEEAGR